MFFCSGSTAFSHRSLSCRKRPVLIQNYSLLLITCSCFCFFVAAQLQFFTCFWKNGFRNLFFRGGFFRFESIDCNDSLSQWTLKKKSLNGLFSLLNMESPKVQKVSHWLSKMIFSPQNLEPEHGMFCDFHRFQKPYQGLGHLREPIS